MLADQLADRFAVEGQLAGQRLPGEDPQRILIAAAVHRLPLDLLRRHVARRADRRARLGERHAPEGARDAEVAHQRPPRVLDHHVGGLHVAVDDALAMRVVQRAPHLLHDTQDLGERQATALVDDLLERAPANPLHRVPQERAARADAKDRHDIRVVERRGDLALALEALGEIAPAHQLERQDLDRHLAIQLSLLREEDERHPAAAEQIVDLILAAQLAAQRGQ